jgi:hypothetical protein
MTEKMAHEAYMTKQQYHAYMHQLVDDMLDSLNARNASPHSAIGAAGSVLLYAMRSSNYTKAKALQVVGQMWDLAEKIDVENGGEGPVFTLSVVKNTPH